MRIRPIASLVAVAVLASLPHGVSGAWAADEDVPPSRRIAEGVTLIPGALRPGEQPDGNTVVFDAPQGLVVLDTGRYERHSHRILDFAADEGRPVAAIVNSHWHLDHISGNAAIRDAFPSAEVHGSLAIDGALIGFLAGYRVQLLEAIAATTDETQVALWRAEVERIDLGPRSRPTVPITGPGERAIAGHEFRVGFSKATTLGDVWLYDPKRRVLASGDLVTLPVPFLDTACPQRWRAAFADVAAVDFDILVPGHGKPMDREGFNLYRRAFNNLLVCAATPTTAGTCAADWKRDASALLTEADRSAVDEMIGYYVEYRLRGPAATRDCAE